MLALPLLAAWDLLNLDYQSEMFHASRVRVEGATVCQEQIRKQWTSSILRKQEHDYSTDIRGLWFHAQIRHAGRIYIWDTNTSKSVTREMPEEALDYASGLRCFEVRVRVFCSPLLAVSRPWLVRIRASESQSLTVSDMYYSGHIVRGNSITPSSLAIHPTGASCKHLEVDLEVDLGEQYSWNWRGRSMTQMCAS